MGVKDGVNSYISGVKAGVNNYFLGVKAGVNAGMNPINFSGVEEGVKG